MAIDPITHRWPKLTNSKGSLLNLLRPIPYYSDAGCNTIKWDNVASWAGFAGAGLFIVQSGVRNVGGWALSLKSAGRLVGMVVGAGVVEVLVYWSVRSPLWFLGTMWLLSKADMRT